MLLYEICPDLLIQDHTRGCVYNKRSGEQFAVSPATLTLLGHFSTARAIEVVVRAVSGSKVDAKQIRAFIESLIGNGLLQQAGMATLSSDCSLFDRALATPTVTLFSAPTRKIEELESNSIAFLGVPFDLGTTGYPGTRYGPERLRQYCNGNFDYTERLGSGVSRGWAFDCEEENFLQELRLRDVGDVIWEVGEPLEAVHSRVSLTVQRVFEKNAFPVVIGGDHSITYGIVKAAANRHSNLELIHIDAHTDLGELRTDCCHHHGNFVTRLRSEGIVRFVHQFGVRGNTGFRLQANDYRVTPGSPPNLRSTRRRVKETPCHLTVDIDVLDPMVAPGTGTPVVNGWSLVQLNRFLQQCCATFNVVSFDLVEVNPMRDVNDQTVAVAVDVLARFLTAWSKLRLTTVKNAMY